MDSDTLSSPMFDNKVSDARVLWRWLWNQSL